MAEFRPDTLYYGDNLEVLRDFPSECVDLVYLDPPFNSNRSYNVLFKEAKGNEAEAQIEAFGDTWTWGAHTSEVYEGVVSRGDDLGRLLQAFVSALGRNDVTAYLTMMAPRLVELRRVMKPTASIYLHCDPTASHYLKVLMDAIFGPKNFVNEVAWKRTTAHSDSKQGSKHFGRTHDVILFYAKGEERTWHPTFLPYEKEYEDTYYKYVDETGRRYWRDNLTAAKPGGDTSYEWHGVRPPSGRYWAYSKANMERLEREGRIVYSKTGTPMYKRYLDEMPGRPAQDIWDDIRGLGGLGAKKDERQGYATQKPEALLERIIAASSSPGDVVLDPFCGCGTATVAAHRLGRQFIGIDITYLAVDLMRRRLVGTFPQDYPDAEAVHVDGDPADEAGAQALADRDKYQFQFWAVAKLEGVARSGENRKGMDRGIDGVATFPEQDGPDQPETRRYEQVIISVKGGGTNPSHVRDLRGVIEREKAPIGVLVTRDAPTREMTKEANNAGLYTSPWDGKKFPRLQIITAGDIVHGKRIDMPSQRSTSDFSRARASRERAQKPRLL